NVTLAGGTNVTITTSGNTLTINSPVGGGVWSLNGPNTYFTGGNVGLGTIAPSAALDVSNFNGNALEYLTAPRPNLIFRDSISANARSVFGGWSGGFRFYNENYWSGLSSIGYMTFDNNGYLGINTVTPGSMFDVAGGSASDVARIEGTSPSLTFTDNSVGYR